MSVPVDLTSEPEQRAKRAEDLPAFRGLKLVHIKDRVTEILGLIGRNGMFDEYTKHDISHIDAMLEIVTWLVPEQTKTIMTPTDWLLIVLATYFHDLGMLVTEKEFENRPLDRVDLFRDDQLFAGQAGEDYRARVEALGQAKADRFIYQEFVRAHHAQRIKGWIAGESRPSLGDTDAIMMEVRELLSPLPEAFRADLALVCESHHLSDLNDVRKYPVSKPYGRDATEEANVQYAAVLLRTADLLHITSDRTPSVLFRLISPTDPVSQEEWAKQMAVTAVRSQAARDEDGNVDPEAPRDTVEVFAEFREEGGFFGLTSYLRYAADQLGQCHEWVEEAHRRHGAAHLFPWRVIDDEQIATKDFLRETFEFTIDQARVLDLLTGHTLYNDTRVVLRELIQNSLDAIRLQGYLGAEPGWEGKIRVEFDTEARCLTVVDNGTGMTQRIIEQHLLKVGASLYQDPDFREEHPDFSAISRFGIGVLSTFMIADSVDVTTCHPEEAEARRLSLRSVHGRYLIRLLSKETEATSLAPHGTRVDLRLRPSAKVDDVLETVKTWVVIPKCEVEVVIDGAEPHRVGYESPSEALTETLREMGSTVTADGKDGSIQVRERTRGGVTVAYGVRWSDYFREWTLVSVGQRGEEVAPFGTCVEGVRVELATPGYQEFSLAAIANAVGPDAPKTNVARSGLEDTEARVATLGSIYSIYCDHVRSEMTALIDDRGFSPTWAAYEARFLIRPVLAGPPIDAALLTGTAAQLPLLLLDEKERRDLVSPAQVSQRADFWTVDSLLFSSVEALFREVSSNASLKALGAALGAKHLEIPDPVVTGTHPRNVAIAQAFEGKEVAEMVVNRPQRRIDLRWAEADDPPRWRFLGPRAREGRYDPAWEVLGRRSGPTRLHIAARPVPVAGYGDEVALRAFGEMYVLHGSPIGDYLNRFVDEAGRGSRTGHEATAQAFVVSVVSEVISWLREDLDVAAVVEEHASRLAAQTAARAPEVMAPFGGLPELVHAMESTRWRVFDPAAWQRPDAL